MPWSIIYKLLAVAMLIISIFMWTTWNAKAPLKKEIATAKAQVSAVQAARVTEQTIIKADAVTSKTYQEGLQDGKKDLNAAIAKLRAERLRHHAAASASVPSASATASRCYGEAGSDVLESMARLAGEADDVARQLEAAQELLRNRQ